ncbi:phosphotransferase [Pontixanthobacter aestiaquae]|uniref:Phosphotransferase n=1 Tax=Pontixanthobacter aestiaquae TaxID=1509367 RepID=A0A844YZ86_9SPHN|nr:phosphotransferase [Pontixanthobacter aestiaquae]MDN3647243.1 phosphotransferase [Pontixanthobacter aestiaquae]MXO81781.1 phosphotransferase [Pontixanthobacter aestiaquae]
MIESIDRLLQAAMQRAGVAGEVTDCTRLTGGATMESWHFWCGGGDFILRRAPSIEFMRDRPFGHDTEAAIIRAANAAGVTAPEVIAELEPKDGLGSGFIMRALPGTPDPRAILAMEEPRQLLQEAARDLAIIHGLSKDALPQQIPERSYSEMIEELVAQFEEAGGDRPIIALGLKWLRDNLPEPAKSVLNHGDFRLGNLLAEDSHITGVLDWELAHYSDFHEDLAFGCMPVWRFSRYDRPALGLGSLEDYFTEYEAKSGRTVDPQRFRFWMIYRTVWWALGCLRMAKIWRSGEDRMLERVVISRRTSEQELDLLMLLEEDAPEEERQRSLEYHPDYGPEKGEADIAELAVAVSEWLTTMKEQFAGHDRFQLAVALNALGIVERDRRCLNASFFTNTLSEGILSGKQTLATDGLLARLREDILDKLGIDSPKYPALAVARKKWTGED